MPVAADEELEDEELDPDDEELELDEELAVELDELLEELDIEELEDEELDPAGSPPPQAAAIRIERAGRIHEVSCFMSMQKSRSAGSSIAE